MLRNKTFLVGLGCGLIFGAVLLQLMWSVEKMENKTSETAEASAWTQDQIKQEAERLNLKVIPKEQTAYTAQQIDEIKQKAADDEKARATKTGTPAPSATPAPTATPVPTPAPTVQPKEKNSHTVYIPDRSDATSVAALLVQAHVLEEPTKFIAMLEEQKLSSKIFYGYFTFENSPEVAEVVKKITTLP